MDSRKTLVLLGSSLFLATVLLTACGGIAPSHQNATPTAQVSPIASIVPTAVTSVRIVDEQHGKYTFSPAILTIKVGTQVIWTNESNAPHTVSSTTGAFGSEIIEPKQTFMLIFSKLGTYRYYCNIHLDMQGTIVVTS